VKADAENAPLTLREHSARNVLLTASTPALKRQFREINERIAQFEERSAAPYPFVGLICECLQSDCTARVEMTVPEYYDLVDGRRRFLLDAGHADPERDRVLAATDRFMIVERPFAT
jgi:hypothetical protein